MAHSHVCLGCGHDLARVRAIREPHYGFTIVRCPDCERVAVRRRHPAGQLLRWLIRLDAALTGLVLRVGIGIATANATGHAIHLMHEEMVGRSPTSIPPNLIPLAIAGVLLAPLSFGAWLALAFEHWRRHRAWLFGLALLAGVNVASWLNVDSTPRTLESLPNRLLVGIDVAGDSLIIGMIPVVAAMSLATLAFPLAPPIRRLGRLARRTRFAWYRRSARRQRFIPG